MDGTRLGTAILFFSFTQAIFKPTISILPLLLLCQFKNSRHIGATCSIHPSPLPKFEVQVSQGRAGRGMAFPLGGTGGEGFLAASALQWSPSSQRAGTALELMETEVPGPTS